MTLEAGLLRHRVRIELYQAQLDTSGNVIQNPETGEISYAWDLVGEVWASIEPVSAREFIAAQAIQSKITTRITVRPFDGLNAKCRLIHANRHGTRIYNVEGVLPDKESGMEYWTLPCSEGISDGQ